MSDSNIFRKFEAEKKKLVPKKDFLIGHPFEDKLRRLFFKADLKHPPRTPTQNTESRFNGAIQTPIRTIVSKTYSDMFKFIKYSTIDIMTEQEKLDHINWAFEELESYQANIKALVLKHFKELQDQ